MGTPGPGAAPSVITLEKTTRWWWLRHAPVPGPGISGQSDPPCDLGDDAAFAGLAAALPEGALWVCGPLSRARDTASAIGKAGMAAPAPLIEPAFTEQHFGRWQGLTWDRVETEDEKAARAFWRNPATARPPGGESFQELAGRVAGAIERLGREHAGRDIIAVAHAGPIRAALALALDVEPGKSLSVDIDPLSLTRLECFGQTWRVGALNIPFMSP